MTATYSGTTATRMRPIRWPVTSRSTPVRYFRQRAAISHQPQTHHHAPAIEEPLSAEGAKREHDQRANQHPRARKNRGRQQVTPIYRPQYRRCPRQTRRQTPAQWRGAWRSGTAQRSRHNTPWYRPGQAKASRSAATWQQTAILLPASFSGREAQSQSDQKRERRPCAEVRGRWR